jgi:hypothetical protein
MGLLYHGSGALARHSVVWLVERLGNLRLVSFCPPVSLVVRLFLSVLQSLLGSPATFVNQEA